MPTRRGADGSHGVGCSWSDGIEPPWHLGSRTFCRRPLPPAPSARAAATPDPAMRPQRDVSPEPVPSHTQIRPGPGGRPTWRTEPDHMAHRVPTWRTDSDVAGGAPPATSGSMRQEHTQCAMSGSTRHEWCLNPASALLRRPSRCPSRLPAALVTSRCLGDFPCPSPPPAAPPSRGLVSVEDREDRQQQGLGRRRANGGEERNRGQPRRVSSRAPGRWRPPGDRTAGSTRADGTCAVSVGTRRAGTRGTTPHDAPRSPPRCASRRTA